MSNIRKAAVNVVKAFDAAPMALVGGGAVDAVAAIGALREAVKQDRHESVERTRRSRKKKAESDPS